MRRAALVIKDASVGYGSRKKTTCVVSEMNATISGGELVALIGRNGAGKSTLLRTLAAYQPPLSGRVEFTGTDIGDMSQQDIARQISVVLTTVPAASLTVEELVSLGRTPYTNFLGRLRKEDKDAVENAMELMGVASFAKRRIEELSDGERQKCMIAKALAQETPVMLLDEPTAYLDYPSKVNLFGILKRLAKENKKAVIVSTHDLDLALRLADKVWLVEGKRLYCGTVSELASQGVIQSFIDSENIHYDAITNRIEII